MKRWSERDGAASLEIWPDMRSHVGDQLPDLLRSECVRERRHPVRTSLDDRSHRCSRALCHRSNCVHQRRADRASTVAWQPLQLNHSKSCFP